MLGIETKSIHYITIATRGYLNQVAVLANSLRQHHPGSGLTCYLVENSVVPCVDEIFDIVPIRDLGIPNFEHFCFQYTPFEISCALKPYCLLHALSKYSASVLYLDADMLVTHTFTHIINRIWKQDILVTPHLRRPAVLTDFSHIFLAGQYNAGFVAVRDTHRGHAFLSWWRDRLSYDCYQDLLRGVFVDQRWLEMAVSLFDGIDILRHTGINTAYWNLHECRFHQKDDVVMANDSEPLCLFHFSSFVYPGLASQQKDHFTIHPVVDALAERYHKLIAESLPRYAQPSVAPYEFSQFTDGSPITQAMREVVRLRKISLDINPFEHPEIVQSALPMGDVNSILGGRRDYQFSELKDRCERQSWQLVDCIETKQRLWHAENRLERLAKHPVFGPMLRFWGRYINSSLSGKGSFSAPQETACGSDPVL